MTRGDGASGGEAGSSGRKGSADSASIGSKVTDESMKEKLHRQQRISLDKRIAESLESKDAYSNIRSAMLADALVNLPERQRSAFGKWHPDVLRRSSGSQTELFTFG